MHPAFDSSGLCHAVTTSLRVVMVTMLLALLATTAHASHLPIWELGVGGGGVSFPDYRGSDEGQAYVAPFPVGVYRGRRVSVDRRGLRTMIFSRGKFALNASADFGVPVSSEDNEAREGMPDLDLMIHVGPSFDYTVLREVDDREVARFKLPVHLAFALDLSEPYSHGWFAFPHFNYSFSRTWSFGTTIGPTFATRNFHKYYYDVAPEYATAQRGEYSSEGGYSGFRFSAATSRRWGKKWFGVFVRYENYRGSVFEDSPLVKAKDNATFGLGFTWFLMQSSEMAPDSPLTEPDTM
jgi:outer membrane scaffolding protein for murein synthesis (MipA/OmpV family)